MLEDCRLAEEVQPAAKAVNASAARAGKGERRCCMEQGLNPIERKKPLQGYPLMGRKRDLKNVYPKRPPALTPDDPEDLNEWGEELRRMTEKRRRTHEQRKPGKDARED